MLDMAFDQIQEGDLNDLILNGVSETREIEYKVALPHNDYDGKKEFLADVSSFANASGGDLIYGIREENGMADELVGISGINPDEEIQRFENQLRDGVEPRMQGVQIQSIKLQTGLYVLIVRIPRSWNGPHVVRYQKHWRFYSRNSAGKYPLDVSEVRSAFSQSEGMFEKIRSFRNLRVGLILADDLPVNINPGARIILHIVPLISQGASVQFPIDNITRDTWNIPPIGNRVESSRYNFDGFLTIGAGPSNIADGYVQIFRNGIVESVDTGLLDKSGIPITIFERELVGCLEKYLKVLERMGVPSPFLIMVTLIGVSGFTLVVKSSLDRRGKNGRPIERDTLLLPDVIVQTYTEEPARILHPIFNSIWNAAGWPRSLNYDDEGEWKKGPNWSR